MKGRLPWHNNGNNWEKQVVSVNKDDCYNF